MSIQKISAPEAFLLKNPIFIDVRTPLEHQSMHLKCAHMHLPLAQIGTADLSSKLADPNRPIIMVCQGGKRAMQAAEELSQKGYQNIFVLEGGLSACIQTQPNQLNHQTNVISLERQVRITAGLLIMIGCTLTFFISPLLIAIPFFIGLGLSISGLTNTCGMAMILAQAPWNKTNKTV